MAMSKKEKAEFDAAILTAKTIAALRWTDPVEKDVPIPEYGKTTTGFEFNSYSKTVDQMWSEAGSHGRGESRNGKYGSASQRGRQLYSTKLLALKALRHAVECEAADSLRKIDDAIEAEKAAATNQGGHQNG